MNTAELVRIVHEWCTQRPVRLCVLFGSQATGRARLDSDVDLAIWSSELLSAAIKLRWLAELQDQLNKEVSLVLVSADLDPVLGFEIVCNGRLIFEREPGLWLHHQAQLWHAYNDSLPFRRAARQSLRKFADDVRAKEVAHGA